MLELATKVTSHVIMTWKNLIKTALIGTDRSELSESTLEELKQLGVDIEMNPANILLEGATLFAQMRKAGFQPKKWEGEIPLPSQNDKVKICSKKSSDHLAMILNGTYETALDEFIQHLIFNKKSLPPELLPELLEKCRSDKALWQKLHLAIGERGNWLIDQNEDWHFLIGKKQELDWETSRKTERVAILNALRKTQPDEALELIESTWEEDDWQHRADFLKTLKQNISLADEPFLEKCLDARRKEIRRTAASLLEKIEGSALRKRMWERVQQFISIKNKKAQKLKIEVQLPDTLDDATLRDGIDPRKKWAEGGLKASYFAQMFIIIPPARWEVFFEKNATEVLDVFVRSEWAGLLIQASIAATVRHKDENWMATIGSFYFKNHTKQRWQNLDVKPLLEVLPEHLFNQFAIKELKDFKAVLENDEPIVHLLQLNPNAWDKNLTLLLMKNLKYIISQNINYGWNYIHYRNMLDRAAYGSDPSLYDILNKTWSNDENYWTNWGKEIDVFLQVLKFRRDLIAELET